MESRLGRVSCEPGRRHRSFPQTRPLERSYRVAGRKHRGDVGELAGGIIFPRGYLHPSPKIENTNRMGSFDLSVTSSHHTRYVIDRDMVLLPMSILSSPVNGVARRCRCDRVLIH